MDRTKKARLKELTKRHDEVYAALLKARQLRDELGEGFLYEHGPRVAKLEAELKAIEADRDPLRVEAAQGRVNLTLVISVFAIFAGFKDYLFMRHDNHRGLS